MNKREIILGLFIALILAFIISPFASQWPDGLEKVAENLGFLKKAEVKPALSAPLPDYLWPGLKNAKMAASFAAVFGTLLVFGLAYGLGQFLKKRKIK